METLEIILIGVIVAIAVFGYIKINKKPKKYKSRKGGGGFEQEKNEEEFDKDQ